MKKNKSKVTGNFANSQANNNKNNQMNSNSMNFDTEFASENPYNSYGTPQAREYFAKRNSLAYGDAQSSYNAFGEAGMNDSNVEFASEHKMGKKSKTTPDATYGVECGSEHSRNKASKKKSGEAFDVEVGSDATPGSNFVSGVNTTTTEQLVKAKNSFSNDMKQKYGMEISNELDNCDDEDCK